jgi:uncharacterized RDD family membrane protein YckC
MSVPGSAAPPAPPPATGKADLTKRFIAALIDGVLMAGVSFVPFIGGIVGAVYMLLRDGLDLDFMDGRSIGKKLLKLRPVRLDGQKMDIQTSVMRNFPLAIGAVGSVFMIIPILGWIVAILLAVVAVIVAFVEIFFVITDAEGRRWGDKMAGTKVIEVAS